jgi:hypothetical protein
MLDSPEDLTVFAGPCRSEQLRSRLLRTYVVLVHGYSVLCESFYSLAESTIVQFLLFSFLRVGLPFVG